MNLTLEHLKQIAHVIATQFGRDCEVVIHDLAESNLEHSIIFIANGHVTGRQVGDGPSKIVLETLQLQNAAAPVEDLIGYLTRTADGRVLKSSTIYIHDSNRQIRYILSINYDITSLLAVDRAIGSLTASTDTQSANKQPDEIVNNVNDLLDNLITQSVALVGKPVALMGKDDKVAAIQFLNDAGAFLITKSGDKVSAYFGISKYTLYSYIDVNKES
ncbi:MAG: helix-turn-helix transcriptional regulator [Lachnospiraceae bacterium]